MRSTNNQSRIPTDVQDAIGACRSSFVMVFAFSCGYNVLLLAPPIYLLQIYDRVLSSRSAATLLMLTLIASAAVVVGSLLDSLRRAALSRVGAWMEERLRSSVLAAAFEYAVRVNGGSGTEAYRDLTTLRQFIASPSNVVLFDAPWSLLFLGVLFLVHPILGAIGAAGAILLLGCALASDLLTRGPLSRAQAADVSIHKRLNAALRNVQTIRAMGMADGAARLVHRDAMEASQAHDMANGRSEILQAISKSTRSLTQVLTMGTAGWLVIEQHVSAGVIFAASLLLGRGLGALEGLIAGWKAFATARSAYERLASVMDVARSRGETTLSLPRPTGGIAVENVSFVPTGTANLVLQGITLSLQPGECLGVIGPSGAGKSTLGRMIAGIATPTMGRVRLDGAEMSLWLDAGCARYLGYLPQEVELFEGSVKDNIARLGDAEAETVIAAAKLVGLHDAILRLPRGYDTTIGGAAGIHLSGGQRQSIGLARAFFGAPQVLLLDEPNSSLDEAGEQLLYRALEQQKAAGKTIIIITHRLGILDLTDKIAVLRGGLLSAFGSSEDIYQRFFKRPELDVAARCEPDPAAGPRAIDSPSGKGRRARRRRSEAGTPLNSERGGHELLRS
jgi:ATP-binding cassette subfamily C protein